MKSPYLIPVVLVSSAFCLPAAEKPAKNSKPAMRDVVRHEDIVARMRRAKDPMKNLAEAKPVAPERREAKPVDLLERSDFLSFNGLSTLVPKGAILHVPKGYGSRLKADSRARIIIWSEFLRLNRGWVTNLEVSPAQAEGAEPFPEETIKALEKNPRVVVATLGGGPISVLPPKKPAEEKAAEDKPASGNTPASQPATNSKP